MFLVVSKAWLASNNLIFETSPEAIEHASEMVRVNGKPLIVLKAETEISPVPPIQPPVKVTRL